MGLPGSAQVIEFLDASFGYRAGEPVVCGVSAAIQSGYVTAVVGPNGSGKSTVLKLMLGLLSPQQGQVVWADEDDVSGGHAASGGRIDASSEPERAKWLAYVPQHGSVAFGFSVAEVVKMASAPSTGAAGGEQLESVLDQFDLQPVRERPFENLSGGQQQRVVLARAMLQRLSRCAQTGGAGAKRVGRACGALVLDEPVSAMDLKHAHGSMQALRERAGAGEAVVVVLHDLTLTARYADRVWLMDEGRLVADGPVDEVMLPAVLEPVYGVGLEVMTDSAGRRVFGVV